MFFKTEQKYKGDFKFRVIDYRVEENKDKFKVFSEIVRKLACFNMCRSKIQLAT